MERLQALGYGDEDFNARYDDKTWKWNHLLNQTRSVSEKGSSHLFASISCVAPYHELFSTSLEEHQATAREYDPASPSARSPQVSQ